MAKIGRNSIEKKTLKIFLNTIQKFRLKIFYCYRAILTIPKLFHSVMTSMTIVYSMSKSVTLY